MHNRGDRSPVVNTRGDRRRDRSPRVFSTSQKASVLGPTARKTSVTQISTPLQILNTPRSLKYAKSVIVSGRGSAPGPENDVELTMLPKSFNRLGIWISPLSRISPISLHRRCRRFDPRRSLPCMTDSTSHYTCHRSIARFA